MLTSKPRVPKPPSMAEIDHDIVACEVALFTLNGGSDLFAHERDSLSRKLSELLELRLYCESHRSTILHFPIRAKANRSRLAQPARGLA